MKRSYFILTYSYRGFGYALTCYLALFSGYLISSQEGYSLDLSVKIIPFVLPLFFFANYAICFRYEEAVSSEKETKGLEKQIALALGIVFLLSSIILYLSSGYGRQETTPFLLLISLIVYAFLFYSFGFFLFKNYLGVALLRSWKNSLKTIR